VLDSADCKVVAIDRDPEAIAGGARLVRESGGRLSLVESTFGDLDRVLSGLGIAEVDGIVLDIGVSSMQIDEAERGFSFRQDGPLDMRMGRSGPTAADLIAHLSEQDLAALLRTLGEERRAGAVARAIAAERERAPITTTLHLARVVESVLGRPPNDIHPATRTFQALRIAVNDELDELARALFAAEKVLAPGGRLVVVSFHSLEDRIVKTFLGDRSRTSFGGSRHAPATDVPPPTFTLSQRGITRPQTDEVETNPRARSARLRTAIRTEAPPREGSALAFGVPQLPCLIEGRRRA
jgi:16S rRNA (cytosine1402-N4)-methyltransferase